MAGPWKTATLLSVFVNCVVLVWAQSFLTEPRDTEALLNTPVVMRCRVGQTRVNVFWSVPGSSSELLINSGGELPTGTPGRFSVNVDVANGFYDLEISEAQVEDAGVYVCNVVLSDSRGDLPPMPVRSGPATLTVVQVPPTGNPACWIKEGREALIGDNLSFQCASSDPAVVLMWYLRDIPLSSSPITIRPQGTGISSMFLAQASADQQKFTCQPDNALYESCDVTLKVRHPPVVTIEGDNMLETGLDASFTCVATGNPPDFAYTWRYADYQISFEEHPRFNKARLEQSGSRLVLPQLTMEDDNITIRCEAVNTLGSSSDTHVIRVRPGQSLAQLVGPILLGIILGLVLIVLLIFTCWWRGKRRKIKEINKKKKTGLRRTLSRRDQDDVQTVDSGIVYTQTLGGFGSRYGKTAVNGDPPRSALDLESAGYGPDLTSIPAYRATAEDDPVDDGALRPIPRLKSTSSVSSLANGGKRVASTTADDAALISPDEEKSFTYHVNPNFDDYRNSMRKSYPENDFDPEDNTGDEKPTYNIESDYNMKPINGEPDDSNVISTEL